MALSRNALAVPLFLLALQLAARPGELRGTVVEVVGANVKIRLEGDRLPSVGDTVQIGSDVPGVGFVAMEGTWRVTKAHGNVVAASPDGQAAGKPTPGMVARIVPTISPVKPKSVVRPPQAGPPSTETLALERAVAARNAARVAQLLKAGADPNYAEFGDWTLLMEGARIRSPEVVKLLLAAGADPNTATSEAKEPERLRMTALMSAAEAGSAESVRLLLEAGATVGATTRRGATALLFAARSGSVDTVGLLLRAGADVNATTTEGEGFPGGRSALMEAAERGYTDTLAALIRAKAKVNQTMTGKSHAGYTALRAAAHFGYVRVVQMLLDAGADPDIATTGDYEPAWAGYTPLHAAVQQKHAAVVKALLDAGADPGIASARGESPLQLAERVARAEIAQLVRDAAVKHKKAQSAKPPPQGKTIRVDKTQFSKVYPAVWFSPSTGEISPLVEESEAPPDEEYEIWIEPRGPEFACLPKERPKGLGFALLGKGIDVFNNPEIPADPKLHLELTRLVREEQGAEHLVFYCKTRTATCLIMVTSIDRKEAMIQFRWRLLTKGQAP